MKEAKEKRFEIASGFVLAILSLLLAVSNIGDDKCDERQLQAFMEKGSAHEWLDATTIEELIAKGQSGTLKSLLTFGAIDEEDEPAVSKIIDEKDAVIERLIKGTKEIEQGSKNVGKENWSLKDQSGELGAVKGISEWTQDIEKLEVIDRYFTWSVLFLQMSLFLGTISLVFKVAFIKWVLFWGMISTGTAGTVLCVLGLVARALF